MSAAESTPLVHLELHTRDLDGARTFYADLCGWREELVRSSAGEYLALDMRPRGEVGGGIVQCAAPRPLWLPYVEVADIKEMTDHARALGARVLLTPREGPAGWRSVVATPAGGELAFWQHKR